MLWALLAGALIVAASLVLGAAIMATAGRPRHSAAAPAAGLSALLVICGAAIKLPGHGVTAAVAVGLALAGSVLLLERSRAPLGSIRPGAILAAVGVVVVVAIPARGRPPISSRTAIRSGPTRSSPRRSRSPARTSSRGSRA